MPRSARLARLLRRAARLLERGFALIGVAFVAYLLCFDLSVMTSGSMSPALVGESRRDGDWVLTEKLSYRFRRPRRWEVVTFRTEEADQRMKRVVGLPGERVSLIGGEVAIGGTVPRRPESLGYLKYYPYGSLWRGRQVACGDGYFVLGDDSKDSQDSRYEGPLAEEAIVGRAWLIVWPPGRMAFVGP